MMRMIAWACIGVGSLLALGVTWLVGFWCGLQHEVHATPTTRTPPDRYSPLEQLCVDAISYFLCCERQAVSVRDIASYVQIRNRWAGRIRVERALMRLLARGSVTTAKIPGGGSGFVWAS